MVASGNCSRVEEIYTPVRDLPQRSPNALPPDSKGRKRILRHNGIYVRVPNDHPLYSGTGWITEQRLVAWEGGLVFYPGDKIVHRNRDRLDNSFDNLVVKRPGDPFPWPKKVYYCKCGCGQEIKYGQLYVDQSHWKINDEFSKLPVSRQRQKQLRLRANGICTQCCTRPLVTKNHCEVCRVKACKIHLRAYHTNPRVKARLLKACRKWIAKHKIFYGYWQREYRAWTDRFGPMKSWPPEVRANYKTRINELKRQTTPAE